MTLKKFIAQMTCFRVFYVFFRNLYQSKNYIKKKPSIKYIKKSILNTTQKNFLQKNYSFNRYDKDKFQIFTIIF